MFVGFIFLLFAAVAEGAALKKDKKGTPLKRGGLSSKVKARAKHGSGLKVEGTTHHVMHGMNQLSNTLQKLRGAASDGTNGMTDDARKQFLKVIESAVVLEEKMAGHETSDAFKDIIFESQLLLELIAFKQTDKIDADVTTNLLEAQAHMFQERSYFESNRLIELVGMDVFDDMQMDPDLFTDIFGGYSDEEDMYMEGVFDEISMAKRNELMDMTKERWGKLEPVLKTKGFKAPGKLTEVRNCMFWWVEPLNKLMLAEHVSATATLLNFTQEVGSFLGSEEYTKSLDTPNAAKARATGKALAALGKMWYSATSLVEIAKVRNTMMGLRPDVLDVARHAPKDIDASHLHLPQMGVDSEAFAEAFTGGMGRKVLKEEFQETLYLPEDCMVKKAWYGDAFHTRGKLVTEIVSKRLASGETVYASNDLFGDTAFGVGKVLIVDYERKEKATLEASEEFNDNIPQIAAESLIAAFYGTKEKDRGYDVTAKVKALLKDNKPVNASYEIYGDPAHGIGKWLFVDYNQRVDSVSELLESKLYAMKLILESAQDKKAGVATFVPDMITTLAQGVSKIQTLKESDLIKKSSDGDEDDSWYWSRGVMSLRDVVNMFTGNRQFSGSAEV